MRIASSANAFDILHPSDNKMYGVLRCPSVYANLEEKPSKSISGVLQQRVARLEQERSVKQKFSRFSSLTSSYQSAELGPVLALFVEVCCKLE